MNYITQKNLGGGGRLGNQMFGVASVLGFAEKHNLTPMIPEWKYSSCFKNKALMANLGKTEPTQHYHEPYFHYTPIEFEDLGQGAGDHKVFNLHGYFQSIKYWDHCQELIKEQFQPSEELFVKCAERLFGYGKICAIHIRRGDYVDNPFYAQLGVDYYRAAIEEIKGKVNHLLVFSDDIEYCKKLFVGFSSIEVEFIEGQSDIEDLFLMSKCDHNIMANSSFSWWGAYLNSNPDKVVIAPKAWFGEDTVLDTKDLYLPNWIVL